MRYKNKKFLSDLWHEEYVIDGKCAICGNYGFFFAQGILGGAFTRKCKKVFCICPNGRTLKYGGASLE